MVQNNVHTSERKRTRARTIIQSKNFHKKVPIGVINQSIVKNPVGLVDIEYDQFVELLHMRGRHQQYALYHPREVPQVEQVVALARRGEKLERYGFVYFHYSPDYCLEV